MLNEPIRKCKPRMTSEDGSVPLNAPRRCFCKCKGSQAASIFIVHTGCEGQTCQQRIQISTGVCKSTV